MALHFSGPHKIARHIKKNVINRRKQMFTFAIWIFRRGISRYLVGLPTRARSTHVRTQVIAAGDEAPQLSWRHSEMKLKTEKKSEEAPIDGGSIGIGKLTVTGESVDSYSQFESASLSVFTKLRSRYGLNVPLIVVGSSFPKLAQVSWHSNYYVPHLFCYLLHNWHSCG